MSNLRSETMAGVSFSFAVVTGNLAERFPVCEVGAVG